MSPAIKTLVLEGLGRLRGDDLARAKAAFRRCTQDEMEQQFGMSGQTRREILAEYQAHDDSVAAAIAEVQALP